MNRVQRKREWSATAYPAAVPRGGTRASFIDLVCWVVVALVGLFTLTQATGWTGTAAVAVVQSLTPYLAVTLVPVVSSRSGAVGCPHHGRCGRRLRDRRAGDTSPFPDPQPQAAANSNGLRVASLNLLFGNPEIDSVAELLADVDVDVTRVQRVHPRPPGRSRSERTRHTGSRYRSDRAGPSTGIVVWSRFPITEYGELRTSTDSIELDVQGPDGVVHLVAMHIPTPINDFDGWRGDLQTATELGRNADAPTLLIGDLNSSYWHPDFRRLLDAGFVDANIAAGSGFSTSWPTDWWVPPFVRLDHALTTGGLVSTDVYDLDVPGSDHRGLVVTVAPAR